MKKKIWNKLWTILEFVLSAIIILTFLPQYRADWKLLDHIASNAAYLFIILSLLPGIFFRLRINSFFRNINIFLLSIRKHMGILSYITTLGHTFYSYILPQQKIITLPYLLSDWMGIVALIFLTPLFVTSNDFSIRLLKSKWKKLHLSIHGILWFILLHVLIKQRTIPTILLGITILLDIFSWIVRLNLLHPVLGYIEKSPGKNSGKPKEKK